MKKKIINLLFVSSFLFTGCSETKKEDTLKNTDQSNKSDQILDNRAIHSSGDIKVTFSNSNEDLKI